jgi:signal transduction histidine kinase
VTIWISCVGFFEAVRELHTALIFARLSYYLGSVISTTFLYFFLIFPDDSEPSTAARWTLIVLEIIFAYLFLFTNTVIYDVFPISNLMWGWKFGNLSLLFEISFFGFFSYGIFVLYKKFRDEKYLKERNNLKYMLLTIVVGLFPPSILTIILPRFGYFDLNWVGPLSEIIWIPILSYSIIKYQQMNVRAVITEVLAIAMTAIFFINIFVNTPWGIWDDVLTFVVFVILAIFLIRGALREAKQKEQLKDLNDNLEQKVAAQTVEIRHSYDLEKKARRDLEKLNETKDQFIMITQHHLRTPVTNIRWQIESMMDGDKGKLPPNIEQSLTDTKTSVNRLIRIVDDFLSITALKVGSKILTISSGNLLTSLEDVLTELKYDIETMHLHATYSHDTSAWPELEMDVSKMREVVLIIIENAVRYNIPEGKIDIKTKHDDHSFEMTVENTGVGIENEDRNKIFNHLFHRSHQARTAHPMGMGVGLSVARAITRAHHGEITIESDGTDKGAKVKLIIPLNHEV